MKIFGKRNLNLESVYIGPHIGCQFCNEWSFWFEGKAQNQFRMLGSLLVLEILRLLYIFLYIFIIGWIFCPKSFVSCHVSSPKIIHELFEPLTKEKKLGMCSPSKKNHKNKKNFLFCEKIKLRTIEQSSCFFK